VQLTAPPEKRGRFMGAFQTTNMGFRVGSGILIGVVAGFVGVPVAVALYAGLLGVVCVALLTTLAARATTARASRSARS
jgi:hypothetical protein